MVYSSQSPSATPPQHGAAVMNPERQNGIVNRRPVANAHTQSPKPMASGIGTPNIAASSAVGGPSTRQRQGRGDGSGLENGQWPEDVATPVKAFLSSNITPRSGSRKARVESASSTPNGASNVTPSNSRPDSSSIEKRGNPLQNVRASSGLGLRISTPGQRSRASSVISDGPGSSISSRPPLLERRDSAKRTTGLESSPMFVYANDVKASMPSRPKTARSLSKGHSPEYEQSNDGNISNGRISSMSNSPSLDEQKPKFFYANSTPNDSKSPRFSNGVSSQRPPLETIYSAHTTSSPPRAASPLKEEFLSRKASVSKPSPRRHTRLVSNGGTEIKPPEMVPRTTNIARRSSTNSPRQPSGQPRVGSHSRSSSVQSAGPSPGRRSSIALSNTSPIAAERTRFTSMVMSNGTLPHSVNPPAATQELPPTQPDPQPQSPTRPPSVGQSKLDQMNELAANARRERKVLDLEISNSSLLAINRTLEREMRKQNAELRRYRRLSRSGRLAVAPTSRSVSGKMSLLSEGAEDSAEETSLLDSDNEENDHYEDILSGISSHSATSSPASSPIFQAGRARFQDHKQPKIDLGAHRALLLDGQKLNQSIKRCLTQCEYLIASGKTALEYQARAPTPENPGGRVLTPDDNGDLIYGQGQGLLSPSSWTGENPFERNLRSMDSLDGGLETPDYSKWGPPTEVQTPLADISDLMSSIELDEATATDILSVTGKIEDYGVEAAAPNLLDRQNDHDGKPHLDERHSDSEISLDGIDDSLDSSSLDDEPRRQDSSSREAPSPQPAREEKDSSRPSSPSRILNAMRPPDIKSDIPGNIPGNRGSMQNLGHYLQAFSIFGAGQSQS